MTPYETALTVVAQALIDSGNLDTWTIYDHPTSSLDDFSIALAPMSAERFQRDTWRRVVLVGVFVPWTPVETSVRTLDTLTPILSATLEDIDDVSLTGEVEGPVPVNVAGSKYLAQFHPITIETTTT